MEDLLAGVEAAAGLAVHGGSTPRGRVAAGLAGRLAGSGWADAYRRSRDLLPQVAELAAELADLDEVVVAGPATAAAAITRSLGAELTVLDDDPARLRDAVADPGRLARTVLVLTGDDTRLLDHYWRAHLAAGRTEAEASRHFVAVTWPGTALESAARDRGLVTLPADPHARGPYAALTASALVPAALAGVDVADLLDQAELLAPALSGDDDNPALALAGVLAPADRLIALVSDGSGFEGLGDWVAELLAGAGLRAVPVDDPGTAERDTAGVLIISYGGALGPAQVPGGGVRPAAAINGPLGAQFLAWQYAVALAAAVREINPFSDN